MKLEHIKLSETSETENKYCMFSFTCGYYNVDLNRMAIPKGGKSGREKWSKAS